MAASREETFALRRAGGVMLALGFASAVLGAYSLHASMPFNPIKLPLEDAVAPRAWAPQGWKFFTRDPEEPIMHMFARGAEGWTNAEAGTNALAKHWFGADRASRGQGAEAGLLAAAIAKSAWIECEDAPAVCLERAPVGASINNISPRPTLCGTIGLARQKPIPWAWVKSKSKITMPSQVVRLEVSCSAE